MKNTFKAKTYEDFLSELVETDEEKVSELIDRYVSDYKQYLLGMYEGDSYQKGNEEISGTILMTQSPVERMFYISLKNAAIKNGITLGDGLHDLKPQYKVEVSRKTYYIDFCLSVFNGNDDAIDLFIEVDGHKFHNESKKKVAEDKQRERALQTSCDGMITFTGSEVYNDPDGCAEETISTLLKLMKKKSWSMGWKNE